MATGVAAAATVVVEAEAAGEAVTAVAAVVAGAAAFVEGVEAAEGVVEDMDLMVLLKRSSPLDK